MSPLEIITRPLTANEADALSQALRNTPNILGYSPHELRRFPDALLVLTPDGMLAGVCLVKYLPQKWADIAVLYVFPGFRRQGIGERLLFAALARLKLNEWNVLCVSREPSVIRWMGKAEMELVKSPPLPFYASFAYGRHYLSGYRFKEGVRKAFHYGKQPAFRYGVLRQKTIKII